MFHDCCELRNADPRLSDSATPVLAATSEILGTTDPLC
jgi:hypothetical protein